MNDMKLTQTSKDGLTNYYCLKCDLKVGAPKGATVWCNKRHRMTTKQEIEAAEQRRLKREAKKKEKANG